VQYTGLSGSRRADVPDCQRHHGRVGEDTAASLDGEREHDRRTLCWLLSPSVAKSWQSWTASAKKLSRMVKVASTGLAWADPDADVAAAILSTRAIGPWTSDASAAILRTW